MPYVHLPAPYEIMDDQADELWGLEFSGFLKLPATLKMVNASAFFPDVICGVHLGSPAEDFPTSDTEQ